MGFMTRILLIIVACAALLACQSSQQHVSRDGETIDNNDTYANVERLLAQATRASGEDKLLLMLEAAELLAELGDTAWARSVATNLPTHVEVDSARATEIAARRAYVNSLIAAADGYYPLAYENINDKELLANIGQLPPALAQNIRRRRAQYLYDMEYYPASVEERIALSELLTSDQREENAANFAAIWQTLMEIPLVQLNKLAQASNDRIQRGWYELASLSKNNQTNLREQVEQVDRWARHWPEHPASFELPADLQLLRQLYRDQPQKIALLLPRTGSLGGAASAITDGFMAAFYQMQQTETIIPELRFYDTSDSDINALYDRAIAEGAQLVIGPLNKEHITDLSLRGEMPVPTLALNNIDNPLGRIENLYQFGLGVEDEAQLAAQKAWRDGHRRALIIAPNSTWGDRSVAAFTSVWQALGGELSQDYRFEDTNDYSKVIKRALQVDTSEARANEVRALVGSIEFEPRRRQDIDVIFLSAQANQARQVKPILAFHYADDIPVYGTSHIYSGQPEPKLDQDMNGVRFSTLPWFFNNNRPEKKALQKHAENSPNLQPLYALGVDIFYLYTRLKQLEQIEQARFYGETGTLNLDRHNQIRRQQVWAEFKNGRARPLADAD